MYCYCGSFDSKTGKLKDDVIEYRNWRNKERNKGREVPPVRRS